MQKVQITGMVEMMSITHTETSSSGPPSWKVTISLSPSCKHNKMAIYTATNYDRPDQIREIEPGMYVTILYFPQNVHEEKYDISIKAEEILIDHVKTEKERDQFNFQEIVCDETGVIIKDLIVKPYHVKG